MPASHVPQHQLNEPMCLRSHGCSTVRAAYATNAGRVFLTLARCCCFRPDVAVSHRGDDSIFPWNLEASAQARTVHIGVGRLVSRQQTSRGTVGVELGGRRSVSQARASPAFFLPWSPARHVQQQPSGSRQTHVEHHMMYSCMWTNS